MSDEHYSPHVPWDEVMMLLTVLEKAHVGLIRAAAQARWDEIEASLKPEPVEQPEPPEGDTSHNPPPAQREPVEGDEEPTEEPVDE